MKKEIKKSPIEWCKKFDTTILDPDGWRMDGFDFNAPITEKDFWHRWSFSTVKADMKNITKLLKRKYKNE